MKTKLTLLIMAVCLQLWSQDFSIIYDSLYAPEPKYDTVPVVMLISDTTRWTIISLFTADTIGYEYSENTWMFGLEVLQYINTKERMIDPGMYPDSYYNDYWLHKEYLDEKGNSLSEGIIVWDSRKRRKQNDKENINSR
jgi:hypothetical protein